jgi:CheY-like chemotaxis protein
MSTQKHVLIAEDDKFLAEIVGKFLITQGLRVTITHNGEEAMQIMEKDTPDILLLDILLPVLDGHSVMKAMKEKNLDCPVIVMSNLSDKLVQKQCEDMDVKAYFVKSDLDEDALLPAIQKHLRSTPSPL